MAFADLEKQFGEAVFEQECCQAMGAVAGVGAGVDVEMAAAVGALLGVGDEFVPVEEPDAAGGEFDEGEEFGGTVVWHPPIEGGRAFAATGLGGEIGFYLNGVGGRVGDEIDADSMP